MRFLRSAAWIVAVLHCALFLTVVLLRIRYPYELEWIEGGILQHVGRVLASQPIYTAPTLEWTPLLYGPLYYYVSAAASRLIGEGFIPLRLVSFGSSIGVALLIYWLVRRETGSAQSGFFGGALFIAGYKSMGSWYDVARVDGLFVLLLMAVIVALRCYRGSASALVAAGLIGLAFLAKQTTLLAILPIVIWGVWRQRSRTLLFAIPAGVIVGALVLVGQLRTDGWFLYYTMGLAGKHPIVKSILIDFWIRDVLAPASIAALFAATFFFLGERYESREGDSGGQRAADGDSNGGSGRSKAGASMLLAPREFYAALAIGLGGAAWGSRLHEGGWFNVLMPGFAALAILFGLGAHTALTVVRSRAAVLQPRLTSLIYLAVVLQFVRLAYNPFQEIPSRADRETGDRIVATLTRAPGDVFVPDHPYLAERAGKRGTAHRVALDDILRIGDQRADELRAELVEQIAERNFVAALLDNGILIPLLGDEFHREQELIRDDSFWPVVGMKVRPSFLFVRQEDAERR